MVKSNPSDVKIGEKSEERMKNRFKDRWKGWKVGEWINNGENKWKRWKKGEQMRKIDENEVKYMKINENN